MLHTKFQGHRPSGSGEEDFIRVLPYMGMLNCQCNSLQTSNSLARCDTSVVIDSKPHMSHLQTSFLFASLAVGVHTGCSAFPFYTPTKLLIQLYFKNETVLIPKLKIIFIF